MIYVLMFFLFFARNHAIVYSPHQDAISVTPKRNLGDAKALAAHHPDLSVVSMNLLYTFFFLHFARNHEIVYSPHQDAISVTPKCSLCTTQISAYYI